MVVVPAAVTPPVAIGPFVAVVRPAQATGLLPVLADEGYDATNDGKEDDVCDCFVHSRCWMMISLK